MKTYNCKKSFNGMIDIRSYRVKDAIEKGIDLKITCNEFPGEASIYTPKELANPDHVSELHKSKVGGRDYKLYSYNWKGQ